MPEDVLSVCPFLSRAMREERKMTPARTKVSKSTVPICMLTLTLFLLFSSLFFSAVDVCTSLVLLQLLDCPSLSLREPETTLWSNVFYRIDCKDDCTLQPLNLKCNLTYTCGMGAIRRPLGSFFCLLLPAI